MRRIPFMLISCLLLIGLALPGCGSVDDPAVIFHDANAESATGTWTSNGPYGGHVSSVAVSPNFSVDQTIFAATQAGVYKSTNDGSSWSQVNNYDVNALVLSPNYIIDQTIFAGRYKSIDAGTSWSLTGLSAEPRALAISPDYQNDQTIFAGDMWNGIFKSTDGGASWALVNSGLTYTSYPGVHTLAISPSYGSDQTVFVGLDGSGIFKSINGGNSWTQVLTSGDYPEELVVSPNYASEQTVFASLRNSGLFKSTDGGISWSGAGSGLGDSFVYALAISPNYGNDQTLFARAKGVYKSTNGATSWTRSDVGLNNLAVQTLIFSPDYATDQTVFAGTDEGVFKTSNGGTSWSVGTAGLPGSDISSVGISPNYASDQTLFAGVQGGIVKSTNGGLSWTPISGLYGGAITEIGISPNYASDQTLFAASSYFYEVFKSTDGGITWTQLLSGNPPRDFAISPTYASDQTIFVAHDSAIRKSTDGGASWTTSPHGAYSLAISPDYSSDQTVFAGGGSGTILKSTDGGSSWTSLNIGVSTEIWNLTTSPSYASDQTIFAGTDSGVFKSIDGGTSWTAVNTGLTDLHVYYLDISPNYAIDQTLLASPWNGVFRSTNAGTSWSQIGTVSGALAISPDYTNDPTIVVGSGQGVYIYTLVPPTISTMSPNSGIQGQTLDVTISGTYFTGATGVSFGSGITVHSFNVDSSTQITANISISGSAATGARDISVITSGGTATKTGAFTVYAVPPTTSSSLYLVQESVGGDILLNFESGVLRTVGNIGFGGVRGLAYDATSSTLFGVSRMSNRLIRIDRSTGAGTVVGAANYLPPGSNTAEIAVDATGNMFGTGHLNDWVDLDTLLMVDKASGIATPVGGFGGPKLGGLAFDHASGILYGTSFYGELYTINPAVGTATFVGQITGSNGGVFRIAFDPSSGILYGITFNEQLVTVDLTTLVATQVAQFSIPTQLYALDFAPLVAPGISSISPSSGTQGQTLSIIIAGTYLTGATSVSFGPGITVSSFNVDSSTQITANISISGSAATGARDISVITSGGTATKTGGFTVNQALAIITTLSPSSGVQGQMLDVIITGNYLTGATSVSFGSGTTVNSFTVDSDTQITANVTISGSATIGARDVSVTAPGGTATKTNGFIVTVSINHPPNRPTNVSPANETTGISLTPTLQSSAFSDPDPGDSHAASQWQIRMSSGSYSSPVFDTGVDDSNLTSITVPSGVLSYSTTYYWHVRYQDNHGDWSSWSAEISFTTAILPSTAEVVTSTGTGTASFAPSQGNIAELAAVATPPDPPVALPHGMFSFNVTGFTPGQTVTITIVLPGPVSVGTQWWKYQGGAWYSLPIGSDDGDNTITITLTDGVFPGDADKTVNGVIIDPGGPGYLLPTAYGLAISSTEGGSVTTPGEGTFPYFPGIVVRLVASPNAGYKFVNWSGDVDTIADVHDASTTITMEDWYYIIANFETEEMPPVQYDLSVSSTAGGSITTPGEGAFTYDAGTPVSLVATPANGYQFVKWTGDVVTIANANAASTTLIMQGNYSITANFEEEEEKEPPSGTTGGCFIATAAYGTPMAEEIQILRGFRDEYLLTNPLGQALVDLYYRVSPPIAKFITEHPSLKPIVRAGLLPAVAMSALAVNTTPVEKMAIVGLLVLVSVAVCVTRRRHRGPEYT